MCRVTYEILEPSVQRPLFRGVRHERVGEVERCRRRYPLRVDKAKKKRANSVSIGRTNHTQANLTHLACMLRPGDHETQLPRTSTRSEFYSGRARYLHGEHLPAVARVPEVDQLDESGMRRGEVAYEVRDFA